MYLGYVSRACLQMFDWMGGPFLDGLYPAELYNGQEMPEDLQAQQQRTHQNNKNTGSTSTVVGSFVVTMIW